FSLREVLQSGEPVVGIARIQPVLVGVQLALTALWRSYGVHPDAVIGHSMGEVSAAVVAGALTPAEGLKVIATRSRLMSRLSGQGAMALLELDGAGAEELLTGYPDVTVAVEASPTQVVVAGPPDQVDAVVAVVSAQDRLARRVEVDVASHHAIIDPVLGDLRTELADLSPQRPRIPVFVTTGGQERSDSGIGPGGRGTDAVFDADHWVDNLRNPVRFTQAVAAAGAEYGTFIEVSPHPLLSYAIDGSLQGVHHHTLGTLQRDAVDTFTFRTNLNAAHTVRVPELAHPAEPRPVLPATPWHHTRHWLTPDTVVPAHSTGPVATAPAAGTAGGTGDWFAELAWPVKELPAAPAQGRWLVLGDGDAAAELAGLLGAGSGALDAAVLDDGDHAALREALAGAEQVLYAPAAQPRLDVAAAYRLFHAARRLVGVLAAMPQQPKLMVLTRNGQPVSDSERADPAHAVLWGLARTIRLEHPEFWGGIVDVDDAVPAELVAAIVAAQAANTGRDDQAVHRRGLRHVPRLARRAAPAVALTRLESDTSHVVIGATGNVGPFLIRQLAEMGAATIVAVSRSGTAQSEELRAELAAAGGTLVEVAADAADEVAMTALFDRFGNDLPPLEGVYLAALSGSEALLTEMTDSDVTTMFRAKVDAAALLHRLTLRTPVRRFVLFSSITGIIGSRWLGHYTAANAYLGALAYTRRALGLAASVVEWGLWKSWADAQPSTKAAGLTPMPNDVAIRMMPAVLSPDAGVQSVVVAADWPRLAETYQMRAPMPVLDRLLGGDGFGGADGLDGVPAPAFGTLLGDPAEDTGPGRTWRARLLPDAKPYPGGHRVRGVEVVPVSVLLQTLTTAAAPAVLGDVRFEYPVVAEQPRVIRVVQGGTDGDTLTLSSAAGADTPADRWTRHCSARMLQRLPDVAPDSGAGAEVPELAGDPTSMADLQRTVGVDGQPFRWSVTGWEPAPGGLRATVTLPEPSSAAVLDAAVYLARVVDNSTALMLPAAAEALAAVAGPNMETNVPSEVVVEVCRRTGTGTDLVADVRAHAPDGTLCLDLRGLRYAQVDTVPVADAGPDSAPVDVPEWSAMTADEVVGELRVRLRAILARELGMPEAAVDFDRPFPELGLDSMMAMTLLRDAKALVQRELSATMLWNNPTVSAFAQHVAGLLTPAPQPEPEPVEDTVEESFSVLDALFDSVESEG
uniref:SDR family NAD(P)-dependent oxidoreductase n=1 Tax=Mycolicibacterium sp. TaxID=2320850 RepID=UPI0037C5D4D2